MSIVQERKRNPENFNFELSGTILKISPETVDEYILKQIALQALEEIPEEIDKQLEEIPRTVVKIIDTVLRPYLLSRLGGQIIDPRFGREILTDRIIQFSEIVLSVVLERLDHIYKEIENKSISHENIENEVKKIINTSKISFIVIREISNRLFTLLQINAPATVRPPLANNLEGLEIIPAR